MKFLTPRMHGFLDYAAVALLLFAPTLFNFGGWAASICYVLGATQLTLTCSYRILTQENSGDAYDYMSAWLWDENANDAALSFGSWSNLTNLPNWQAVTLTGDATGLGGKMYSMEWYALYDAVDNTWFGVDNCSLKVTACQ